MADLGSIVWIGKSGKKYTHWLYKMGTEFLATPANYIFCKQSGNGYQAIYIGQTGNISERFDNHHKMPCITKNGATHICVHKSSESESERCVEESDLIENYQPICNQVL
jgi:hypothetical protein